MLKLNLLCLRESESTGDISKRLLREDDRARPYCTDLADKLNVFDRFREELQTAAVLLEETQAWAVNLAVDE